MLTILHNKLFTLSAEVAICILIFAFTRQISTLILPLSIFIILELAYASHCYDRIKQNPVNSLKYSRCYSGSSTPTRKEVA